MVGTGRLRRVQLLSFRRLVSKDDTLRWRSWKVSPSKGLRKVKEGWRDPVTMGLSDGLLPSQGLSDAFLTNFLPPTSSTPGPCQPLKHQLYFWCTRITCIYNLLSLCCRPQYWMKDTPLYVMDHSLFPLDFKDKAQRRTS